MKYYLYIIECSDGYLYTGITSNIRKRFREHIFGFCKLTKNRGIKRLVYYEKFDTRIKAAKREKEIKGWPRSKKKTLIKQFTLRSAATK